MKIIFGLGNPGLRYKKARHNVGYLVVERLRAGNGLKPSPTKKNRFKKRVDLGIWQAKIKIKGEEILLIKPNTFMNNSGICVRKVLDNYKISIENCLVVYDDVDLGIGVIRFRKKGGSGGHRGMASVIEHLSSGKINRLRIGIDKPGEDINLPGNIAAGYDLSDYVLADFSSQERAILNEVLTQAVSACIDWVDLGADFVMSKYNVNNQRQ